MATFRRNLYIGLLCWLIIANFWNTTALHANREVRVYDREMLLSLRDFSTDTTTLLADLPEELKNPGTYHPRYEGIKSGEKKRGPRRRGRRGGVRQRLRRRGSRPPLPSVILCNVRSLKNKIEELRLLTGTCFEYRESCLLTVTETWLHPDVPSSLVELNGFALVRADRSYESGKVRGGGVCIYIKDEWCRQYKVKEITCNPDVEYLCVTLRPFYLPREFGNIIICAVYVPPSGNAGRAAAQVVECVHKQLQHTPDAPVLILGDFNHLPSLWKTAIIVPVPKIAVPKENNDYRPVALTSNVMKCFEKLMVRELKINTGNLLDPYQFAYKNNRSCDDAVLTAVHNILQHLEDPKAYARLLFIDFSSAFNTLMPHILLKKLSQWSINPYIIRWYHAFLSERTQQVRVNHTLSHKRIINTGAPQGCVSSPILFTLYTNDCTSSHPNTLIIKFSDDTAILGLMNTNMDSAVFKSQVENFVHWCDDHHLIINVKKTEEVIFDPGHLGDHTPLCIHGTEVTQVHSYKYLGVHIDSNLAWDVHKCGNATVSAKKILLKSGRKYGRRSNGGGVTIRVSDQ
ncbi:hypothetical protein WMY93_015748 [Mugilogobius chulae]|uniref:Reverse transcriptase domain-containing protein n=1 Tax=Mugilogobius chulae TaxID=88201 RepID=A0AAW0NVR2_9GOBI